MRPRVLLAGLAGLAAVPLAMLPTLAGSAAAAPVPSAHLPRTGHPAR